MATDVTLEEMEALRLTDLLDLEASDCSRVMGVSQEAFLRILQTARKKVTHAIVEGRNISFEGEDFRKGSRRFECLGCGNQWIESPCSEGGLHGYEISCPHCGSMNKMKVAENGIKTMCVGHLHHGRGHGCCRYQQKACTTRT